MKDNTLRRQTCLTQFFSCDSLLLICSTLPFSPPPLLLFIANFLNLSNADKQFVQVQAFKLTLTCSVLASYQAVRWHQCMSKYLQMQRRREGLHGLRRVTLSLKSAQKFGILDREAFSTALTLPAGLHAAACEHLLTHHCSECLPSCRAPQSGRRG